MFTNYDIVFAEGNKRLLAENIIVLVRHWYESTARGAAIVFGSEENAVMVAETLKLVLAANVLDATGAEEARALNHRVEQLLR